MGDGLIPSSNPTEAVRRRMAVGKGLRCLPLDPTQLERALGLWDHLFETDRAQAIAHYVDILSAMLKLSDSERHTARLSILREMISASLDLRPPPPPPPEFDVDDQRQPMVS